MDFTKDDIKDKSQFLNKILNDCEYKLSINMDSISSLIEGFNEFESEYILNHGNDDEIQNEKKNMDKIFQENNVTKDDSNFIYDKRIDFNMDINDLMDNDWDDQ